MKWQHGYAYFAAKWGVVAHLGGNPHRISFLQLVLFHPVALFITIDFLFLEIV